MRGIRAAAWVLVSAWMVGCGGAPAELGQSEAELRRDLPAAGAGGITVMTQNLYVGADVEAIFATPPAQIPQEVSAIYAGVQATNFPQRAQRIADEVEANRPDAIALQEVSLIRTQSPGDFFFGNPVPATVVAYDYLALLQSALAARGLQYQVAAVVEDTDVELPSTIGGAPPYGMDIRLTDRDVLLVRSGLSVSNPEAHNYTARLTVSVGPSTVTVLRGWVSADVSLGRREYRVVDTHLEIADQPATEQIQVAQAGELLSSLAGETLPTILLGDFNSDADAAAPTYRLLLEAGFADAWAQANPGDPGYTCCQEADLLNPISELSQRIDLVMVRQPGDRGRIVGGVAATLVGDLPSDKTPSGLWPSDHAGVMAVLRLALGVPLAGR